MITIHFYCSYSLSPEGYCHGVLAYPSAENNGFYVLSPPKDNKTVQFVRTAFQSGFITRVRGWIPDTESYVYLVKRYQYSYQNNHADIGKDVSINMAFEFDNIDEYKRFFTSFDGMRKDENAGLKRKLADLIHADYSIPDYALNIQKESLDDFMAEMLGSQPDARLDKTLEKTFYHTLSAQTNYTNELRRLFCLNNGQIARNEKLYVYSKKNKSDENAGKSPITSLKDFSVIIALIIFLLILLALSVLRNRVGNEI